MGAHYHVHSAVAQPLGSLLLLRVGAEAAHHLHAYGELGQPPAERAVVLQREHGGGYEHGNLLAVHHGLESGANGNFRLAIAHITTNEAVHGALRFHVAFHSVNGVELVVSLLIGEGRFHFVLPGAVGAVDIALHQLALGIEFEQIVGNVGNGLARPLLGQCPVGRAQAANGRHAFACAHIAA